MRDKEPSVSILLPVYNDEKYIAEAVNSIINQTFTDWELIIVDDGSTDDTLRILDRYSDNKQIRILKNEVNSGISNSLNRAFGESNGKFIARMDADDISFDIRLMEQVGFLENNPEVDVVGSNAIYIDSYGGEISKINMPEMNKEIIQTLEYKSPIIHPSVMMRANFLSSFLYDPRMDGMEDYDLWARGAKDHVFHNLQMYLIQYRYTNTRPIRCMFKVMLTRVLHAGRFGNRYKVTIYAILEFVVQLLSFLGYKQRSITGGF